MKTGKQKSTWKNIHKWFGLILTVFVLIFCVSGLILNHRSLFAGCSISRNLLPGKYHIENFNNGIIKGTLPYNETQLLAFGGNGVWLTDRDCSSASDFNEGLPEGADNRNIRNIVTTRDGHIWCAAQFGFYRLNGMKWEPVTLPDNNERISDVTLTKDSSDVVVLTRSAIYTRNGEVFQRKTLASLPEGIPEITLFKTIWQLHSGALFGLTGRIIVDIVAIILIFLCLTGLVLVILPPSFRKGFIHDVQKRTAVLRWNFKWHNKIGYYTIILTIILAFTGMCLRPPLMIPFVLAKSQPIPGTTLDSDNAWNDRFRAIRWDNDSDRWLLSTSEGFISVNEDFTGRPVKIPSSTTPPVSPMGITVFEKTTPGQWLIGSFSGLYNWNPATDKITDYYSGQPYSPAGKGRPLSAHLISGYSGDFNSQEPVVFDYYKGAENMPEMPDILRDQPMSLWNFALELHVGRAYEPIIGPFSELFVFLSGLTLLIILISGLVIHNRHHRRQKQHKIITNKK